MTQASVEIGKSKRRTDIILTFHHENRFLSNFWECDVALPEEVVKGHLFPAMEFNSVENAYQAWKSSSLDQRQKMQSMSSGEVKELSRSNEFQIRSDLSEILKLKTMKFLLEQKFSDKNTELVKLLLDTGEATLVEGNDWRDEFWGVCLKSGQGQNNLGQLIMKIRSDLKS